MNLLGARFVDPKEEDVLTKLAQASGQSSFAIQASADYLGPGAIEVPLFEKEITDMVRRESTALARMKHTPATGHPNRYFEQTAIATGAFTDPRNLNPSANSPVRVERSAYIKAIINQTNIGLFDRDVTRQQGQFAGVVAKDIDDVASGIVIVSAGALWNGNDTSLAAPTTTQYMGLLNQITQQSLIPAGTSIIDGLKSEVAAIMANVIFKVRPTAIYANPLLLDLVDQEAKANHFQLDKTEGITGGVTVEAISTQAGKLPLIPDVYIPQSTTSQFGFSAPPAGQTNYFAVIVCESMIEIAYISGESQNPNPRLFELGLTGNLNGQFVGVLFDCVIAKGPSYAHAVVCVQR